jgi:hypothetical protein
MEVLTNRKSNMPLSSFLLILWVFLTSEPTWPKVFGVDPKFTAITGIAFVVVAIIEAFFYARGNNWSLRKRP